MANTGVRPHVTTLHQWLFNTCLMRAFTAANAACTNPPLKGYALSGGAWRQAGPDTAGAPHFCWRRQERPNTC